MAYTGTEAMDAAFLQRFETIIDIDWAPLENEISILKGRYRRITKRDAKAMCTLARDQRIACREEAMFDTEISTRMLLATCKRVSKGFSLRNALEHTVVTTFSAEGGDTSERAKIRQLMQKVMG